MNGPNTPEPNNMSNIGLPNNNGDNTNPLNGIAHIGDKNTSVKIKNWYFPYDISIYNGSTDVQYNDKLCRLKSR